MPSLLSRATRAFRDVWEGSRPVLKAPCAPLDTRWGKSPALVAAPFWTGAAALAAATAETLEGVAWDRCPDTGAVLPDEPWNQVGGGVSAWIGARDLHRHQWFSTLARAAHETGNRAHSKAASRALGDWLLQDVPGRGVAWVHSSDAAVRLIHWALGTGWLGEDLDPDLRRRIAGSAEAHGEWVYSGLNLARPDHRLVMHAAGLVVAGLTWPELPKARKWWSLGLTVMGRTLPDLLHDDGSPRLGVPAEVTRMVQAVLVARACARLNGVSFPADADAAVGRVGWMLRVLSEGMGRVPPIGACQGQPLLAEWGTAPERTVWNAVVGLGLVPGEATPEAAEDGTAAWLSGEVVNPGPALDGGGEWAMWAFRDSGTIVLRNEVRKQPLRLVYWCGGGGVTRPDPQVHADGFQILLDVGTVPVLVDPGAHQDLLELALPEAHGGCLVDGRGVPLRQGSGWAPFGAFVVKARVDGRSATVVAGHDGFSPGRYIRDLRVEGTKMVVTERFEDLPDGDLEVRWPLGPGFEPEESRKGYVAKHAGITLAIKLDEGLRWTFERGLVVHEGQPVEICVIVGRGDVEGRRRFRNTFEVL